MATILSPASLRTLAIALLFGLTGCASSGSGGEQAADKTGAGETMGDCTTTEPGMAPNCSLTDLGGNTVTIAETSGTVRLVDFWATWCAPCREEIPMFKELYEQYGPQGFTLLAVSMDDGPEVVRQFVDEYEIPYVNVMGTDEVAEAFGGVYGLPTAFLLDGEGKIVERFMGPKPRKVLEDKIRELLGMEPTA